MSKEDTAALMDSEVFRNFARSEAIKEASTPKLDEQELLNDFQKLTDKIASSPELKKQFQHLQKLFNSNAEYTAKVDPKFVEGVLLLDLGD